MRFRPPLIAIGSAAVVVAGIAGCREVPQAPTQAATPPATHVTVTIDTLRGYQLDVGNQWGGVKLLLAPDQSAHVVAFDAWSDRLRYYGCANFCDEPVHWFGGTADSVPMYGGSFELGGAGAVLTSLGFQAVYGQALARGIGVGYAQCPGACNFTAHWSASSMLADTAYLEGPFQETAYSVPLAADAAGGLHLIYYDYVDYSIHYRYCPSACGAAASWQDVPVTAPSSDFFGTSSRLVAVAPNGAVHLLYGSSSGLVHAACLGGCTSAANWQSAPVPGPSGIEALAMTFLTDGTALLAVADSTGAVTFGTCAGPCTAGAAWSLAALPLKSRDVALATDDSGRVYLATNRGTVSLSRCTAGCLGPAGWRTDTLRDVPGEGRVSVVVDAAGHARIASSNGWFGPQVLQYTRMLR